jgi:hypothetical protein
MQSRRVHDTVRGGLAAPTAAGSNGVRSGTGTSQRRDSIVELQIVYLSTISVRQDLLVRMASGSVDNVARGGIIYLKKVECLTFS